MKALYPTSHEIPSLSDAARALKIARHSHCRACELCTGLRPPLDVYVVRDVEVVDQPMSGLLNEYNSDEEEAPPSYLATCVCGHGVNDHGADPSSIPGEEIARRCRVAVRLDELFEDAGKLLDFNYTNEDIDSLRQQMQLPVSPKSSLSDDLGSLVPSSPEKRPFSPASASSSDFERPSKKRRVSFSSLSDDDDDDDDDDEEDKPLAARITGAGSAHRTGRKGQRSGKQAISMKSKAQTAPASMAPPTDEERARMTRPANGVNGRELKVKVEDKMDEGQLTRLATGVTVDAGTSSATPPIKAEKPSHMELRKGIIQIVDVENDGKPRSLVILTGLKTLFQKQLPKMPREYIARLVYDSNSRCLAIIKRGYKVVGGICYRPFPHRGFAEIVFFATASVDQVKGYGGMLMDHFKAHIKKTYPDMMHFLTYADNYAVGYFRKQGFSKEITLDRSIWAGYIKDYEGGTIMQCTMLRKVDYLNTRDLIAQQREAILTKIRQMSRSHIVYPGLQFPSGEGAGIDPKDVPGLRESGWTPSMAPLSHRPPARSAEHSIMEKMLVDLQQHGSAWAFLQPVNPEDVADYYDVIKDPMDFSTMEHKLDTNRYPSLDAFVADAQLIFDNSRTYNPETTVYHKNAIKMERYLKDLLAGYRVKKEE